MNVERLTGLKLLEQTIGIGLKICSNDYEETRGYEDCLLSHHKIAFQVEEEDPDDWAIGILFCISLMSFTYAVPRGTSEIEKVTGLGRLEQLALEAVRFGCPSPSEILKYVSTKETPPQFWGDLTLWAKINAPADRKLLQIEGPSENLPQWEGIYDLKMFRITPIAVWMKEFGFMLRFLDSIPYPVLIVAAILMLLAPFEPMPHVAEKLIMLKQGTLTRPIDIFDLFFHLAPSILLVLKVIRDRRQRG